MPRKCGKNEFGPLFLFQNTADLRPLPYSLPESIVTLPAIALAVGVYRAGANERQSPWDVWIWLHGEFGMRVAIVGRGKMAEEVRRTASQGAIEITAADRLVAGDVVLHFGSGRELAPALAACAQAGIPLVQGSTSITLPEPLPCAVVEAPNLAMVVIQMMTAIKPLAGHVKAVRESHQAGKRDVSATARMFAQQLGFVGPIESIRDPAQQLACGVSPEFLDGHAYHWIECERDGVQIGIALRVHGREAYARGALALARMLSGRRMELRKYTAQEILG